jgi:hypothetical protein
MLFLGPHTGDSSESSSYLFGPHWNGEKGYRVVEGADKYNHKFGGDNWKVPVCKLCNEPMHQIFTFDLEDPRLSDIKIEALKEIPLISCLNCSTSWDIQIFKLNPQNKSIEIIRQDNTENWVSDDENKIPSPLPNIKMLLEEMKQDDIPTDIVKYEEAIELLGSEYLCRILGDPLYAQDPLDRECPICKKEMHYVATVSGEAYFNSFNLIKEVDFTIGEMWLYFMLCKDCLTIKTECQGT